MVEGGSDPDIPAKYHPFYITDDPVGGYAYKTPEERQVIFYFSITDNQNKSVCSIPEYSYFCRC